jgi:hypothetical protein
MTAATIDRGRLSKLLGMLGSAHEGEVVAAARQAERLRAEAGLTWAEIVIPRLPPPARQRRHVETIAEAVEFLLDHLDGLTEWECDFVRSIQRLKYPPSPKQIEVLERLVDKVRRAEARAA